MAASVGLVHSLESDHRSLVAVNPAEAEVAVLVAPQPPLREAPSQRVQLAREAAALPHGGDAVEANETGAAGSAGCDGLWSASEMCEVSIGESFLMGDADASQSRSPTGTTSSPRTFTATMVARCEAKQYNMLITCRRLSGQHPAHRPARGCTAVGALTLSRTRWCVMGRSAQL
eukprot:CAMPEP_0177755234 /NCGR_PEP_ID=MMETSP0491_2-20121128/2454_1 /TAXON_ID=63592 /ORGANISM="Tetraselmis chuii, Strain PLY429" /LENGTH=173 /DNA_ID=CAMNT_0019270711 /DNA_START=18 /DNA_END=540 /DNA_ORIENTATION=-